MRDYIQLITGKRFPFLNPKPEDINILAVACGLSHQCRYAGQIKQFFSIAEHSLQLSYAVPSEYAKWALLHDAAEAFITDIPSPIKAHLPEFIEIENKVMEAVCDAFSIDREMPEIVKEYDARICVNERANLLTPLEGGWEGDLKPLDGVTFNFYKPNDAHVRFLGRFYELS